MTPKVAADIESVCSKCGVMWHVILAMVGDKIAKVQCKQCGAQHRYKSPQPESKTKRAAAKKKTTKKKTTRRGKKAPEPPAFVEPDLSRPIQPYKMTARFEVGDRVQHPKLGLGVVQELPAPGKMQISFDGELKLLVHDRDG